MKEKDLYIDSKNYEMILFAEKEDESYDAIKSGSYVVKHFLSDFYLKKENLDKALHEELKEGNISPVFYYMLMQDMGPGDLARRVGISKRKLRKHFRPDVFAKLDDVTLQKYAIVFGITVEQIKEINIH
ncbi:MAG: hypothetical protein M0Q51_01480 [Bacteroidales bacterium]|nr:hypothetical protein [Bacteroidales bacterium]